MFSYFKYRSRWSAELDRMIVGGMKPSAIMAFLAECEDPLGVIDESAYRFHMFHIDFMMKLTDDEVRRLAAFSAVLPESAIEECLRELSGVGTRIAATKASIFIGEAKKVIKLTERQLRQHLPFPGHDAVIAHEFCNLGRMPLGNEVLRCFSRKPDLAEEEICGSAFRSRMLMFDSWREWQSVDMRFYVMLKRLLQRLPTAVVKEIGRQVVYSPIGAVDRIARKYVINEIEHRRSQSMYHWIERNMLNPTNGYRDLNLTFSFEGLDERNFIVENRAPGYECVVQSMTVPLGGIVPDCLIRAIADDSVGGFNIALAICGDESVLPFLPYYLAKHKSRKIIEWAITDGKHRTELQIPLVFAAASMMDFPEAAALLYKLKEDRLLPIDEIKDCFGNNPIWYLRYREKQDSVPALLQRFRQCGFDEDEQNDMGMSMMEWAEKEEGS